MEVFFTIIIFSVISFIVGRIYEFRTQYNYIESYERVYKELNELHRKYMNELASKIESEV